MKKISTLFIVIIIFAGCRRTTNTDVINAAAVKYSGTFITQYIPSIPTLHIAGKPVVVNNDDSTYHVTGMVEGFSAYNYPVSTEHFSETLRYSGGDPNDAKSWECMEIYVGKKKMK